MHSMYPSGAHPSPPSGGELMVDGVMLGLYLQVNVGLVGGGTGWAQVRGLACRVAGLGRRQAGWRAR